ncbi:MAG: DUF6106 family protein [Synergistaceae bacterium]|nr:DUF6106 family protein [Synergistaceae bacterium]
MDAFIEKLVSKKRKISDYILNLGIVVGSLLLSLVALTMLADLLGSIAFLIIAAIIYFAYKLIQLTSIEFEYIVTNGSLDIDKITAQRKRKRIFSAECRDFEVMAKVKGSNYGQHIESITRKINAASSADPDGEYFIVLPYKGERTVVYFEPDKRMLDSFRRFIPRKILD